jgi:predicted nucleic acid-binding protein
VSLLDSDAVVRFIRRGEVEEGAISVITLIEVLRGVPEEKRGEVKTLLEESFGVLDLDNKAVTTYCALYRGLRDGGEILPDADLLIAATAISRGLSLRTGDVHFERLRSLGLEVLPLIP